MTHWEDHFSARTITADRAIDYIKKGDRLSYGHATGEPQLMGEALVRNQDILENVVVIHGLAMGPALYCGENVDHKKLAHETVFAGAKTRKAIAEGRSTFVPAHFSDVPILFRNGKIPISVAVIHVTLPDNHGYCSFGVSVDYEQAAVDAARLVIAEVNTNMPRTYGDSLIHVTDIDYFIMSDRAIYEMAKPEITDLEMAIGKHCSELIPDGACLQIGMGGIPNAIMEFLNDKNDLGIHTELISDGAMQLMQAGNITNKLKGVHTGKTVATFASGTKLLYEWLNNNPGVEFYPVDYINNSHVIGLNDNVVSINSAIQVDLMGQVCAETINGRQFSGIGGQFDFVRGSAWSKGGKSIIAMPASAKKGEISKIVPYFKPGDAVTTPRNDVDYVVTEFGAAALKGQNMQERARRLIAIADPKFRDELKAQYEQTYGYTI